MRVVLNWPFECESRAVGVRSEALAFTMVTHVYLTIGVDPYQHTNTTVAKYIQRLTPNAV